MIRASDEFRELLARRHDGRPDDALVGELAAMLEDLAAMVRRHGCEVAHMTREAEYAEEASPHAAYLDASPTGRVMHTVSLIVDQTRVRTG